jgi:hypothetical protein
LIPDLGHKVSFVALRNVYDYEVYLGRVISDLDTDVITGGTCSAEACVAALNKRLKDTIGNEDGSEPPFTVADLTQTTPQFYTGCT